MKLGTLSAALSLLVSATALAQTTPSTPAPVVVPGQSEPETLTAGTASGGTSVSGWFLAPTFGTTVSGDRVAYTPGLRGGVYLNKRFAIGVTAQGLVNSETKIEDDSVRNLGTYGGLLLQYIWRSNQLVHGTVESTIGDGRWCAAGAGGSCSHFLIFEPVASVEINLAKHVRLASGVGYRFAVTGSGEGSSGRDLSGLAIRSSLIFGSF
jgi:hypothetical protein